MGSSFLFLIMKMLKLCPIFIILGSFKNNLIDCHHPYDHEHLHGARRPGECSQDDDCPDWNFCHFDHCEDPCHSPGACGVMANCVTRGHVALCACPGGWTGEATKECYKLETGPCPWYFNCSDPSHK